MVDMIGDCITPWYWNHIGLDAQFLRLWTLVMAMKRNVLEFSGRNGTELNIGKTRFCTTTKQCSQKTQSPVSALLSFVQDMHLWYDNRCCPSTHFFLLKVNCAIMTVQEY